MVRPTLLQLLLFQFPSWERVCLTFQGCSCLCFPSVFVQAGGNTDKKQCFCRLPISNPLRTTIRMKSCSFGSLPSSRATFSKPGSGPNSWVMIKIALWWCTFLSDFLFRLGERWLEPRRWSYEGLNRFDGSANTYHVTVIRKVLHRSICGRRNVSPIFVCFSVSWNLAEYLSLGKL